MLIPKSQQFAKSVDEWELDVFRDAIYFTVATFEGRGKRTRTQFDDFAKAVAACRPLDRACVYAVTAAGRAVCVDRALWPARLLEWKIKKGTAKRPIKKRQEGLPKE